MKYSVENSLDPPQVAFEKGQGYCWHQASALNAILRELGFDSRLVHSFKNLFPETELAGVIVNDFVSGHVWCRVTIDGIEKDVCPGSKDNVPGVIHFRPLSNEKCTSCGLCEKVCPVGNIALIEGRPQWHGRCENCLACYNWCPIKAIEGSVAQKYCYYTNPDIKVQKIMVQKAVPKS